MHNRRPGAVPEDIAKLQSALAARGFPPGRIDGNLGPGTEAALLAFQHAHGLLVDGIAGPRTLTALGLAGNDALPSVILEVTVEKVRDMFPCAPVVNIEKHLPVILEGLSQAALREKPMALMALATIRAEAEDFAPISEGPSQFNTSPGGRPFDLYDRRADIGNSQPGDGEKYRGRGFIRLTGKANYRQYGHTIGLGDGLVADPERANDPLIAARLLASFLKARERPIKEALLDGDLRAARRLVNGGSHGLDRFTDCYRRGDTLLGQV